MEEKIDLKKLIEEYEKVVSETSISELNNENTNINKKIEIIERDIKTIEKQHAIKEMDLNGLDEQLKKFENTGMALEFPEVREKIERQKQEIENFKTASNEKKSKLENEKAQLLKKKEENEQKISKVKEIANSVISRAEKQTEDANIKLKEEINKLKAHKEQFGLKFKDATGKDVVRLTPEEKAICDKADEEIQKLENKIKINDKKLLSFKKTIESKEKNKEELNQLKSKSTRKQTYTGDETKTADNTVETKTDDNTVGTKTDDNTVGTKTDDNTVGIKTDDNTVGTKTDDNTVETKTGETTKTGVARPDDEAPKFEKDDDTELGETGTTNTDGKSDPNRDRLDKYNLALREYNENLEELYRLQTDYENGKIPYDIYNKQAKLVLEQYNNLCQEYDELISIYGKNKDSKAIENNESVVEKGESEEKQEGSTTIDEEIENIDDENIPLFEEDEEGQVIDEQADEKKEVILPEQAKVFNKIAIYFDAKKQVYVVNSDNQELVNDENNTFSLSELHSSKEFVEFCQIFRERSDSNLDPHIAYILTKVDPSNADKRLELFDKALLDEHTPFLDIEYNMKGIYSRKYSPEMSQEIMTYANALGESGAATVEKNGFTKFLEKVTPIRKLWERMTKRKNEPKLLSVSTLVEAKQKEDEEARKEIEEDQAALIKASRLQEKYKLYKLAKNGKDGYFVPGADDHNKKNFEAMVNKDNQINSSEGKEPFDD